MSLEEPRKGQQLRRGAGFVSRGAICDYTAREFSYFPPARASSKFNLKFTFSFDCNFRSQSLKVRVGISRRRLSTFHARCRFFRSLFSASSLRRSSLGFAFFLLNDEWLFAGTTGFDA